MFNAISSQLKRIGCFEPKRWPPGGPQSQRPDNFCGDDASRPRHRNVTKPVGLPRIKGLDFVAQASIAWFHGQAF
jgi:hypothetical protein